MPVAGSYLTCERGTLSFPWGTNKGTIEVLALAPASEEVAVVDFIGPRMGGYPNNGTLRPVNTVSILGKYVASDTTSMIARTGMRGAADIQLGSGEHWVGNCTLVSSKYIGQYAANPNEKDLTKRPDVEMVVRFYGSVSRTPVAAG
jgi:hypothetical protein